MASPDRMEVHDNSSDGESSDEENPQQLQDKARRLALALGQKWDAAVARKRLAINKDDLPGARRNTAELMADLRARYGSSLKRPSPKISASPRAWAC